MSETASPATIIRDWRGTRVLLPTRYGPVLARWTSAEHVHVGEGSGYSDDEGTRLVYRGTEWHASIHLYAASGWTEDEPPGYSRYRHQFTACETGRPIGPTWRAAIVAAVSPAIAEFAAAHPEILAEAEVEHLVTKLNRARAAENDAHQAYQRARLEAAQLTGLLRRARLNLKDAQAGRAIS
jgi:hypothetical protein